MEESSRGYLFKAWKTIRATPSLVIPLVIYAGILWVPPLLLRDPISYWAHNLSALMMLAHGFFTLIVYPVIYGKYADIVGNQKQRSWLTILREDWWNLFIVTIILNLPLLIIESLGSVLETELQVPRFVVWSASELIGIYTIPLVFLMKEKIASISFGAKCLLGNIKFSRHLVYLTLVSALISFAIRSPGLMPLSRLLGGMTLVASALIILVRLVVFVAASLILIDKVGIKAPEDV